MMPKLFVMDTNSLVSAVLIDETVSAKALDKAVALGKLALSKPALDEFIEVIFRKKFDKYFFDEEEKWSAINNISSNALTFSPTETITACRDPKDNKFLELAVAANASCIITGDKDLLALHPFRNISILKANEFLISNFI